MGRVLDLGIKLQAVKVLISLADCGDECDWNVRDEVIVQESKAR